MKRVCQTQLDTPPPPPTYGTLPCRCGRKTTCFHSKSNWSLQAQTAVQIVFFGVNEDKVINIKLIKRVLNKQIDGILLGSSLGRFFFFYHDRTQK